MKKFFTSLFLLLVSIALHAESVEVDELTYNLYSNATASVAANQSTNLSGELSIPATITVNDTAYRVVSIASSAFVNCTGLTSVTIPKTVKSIGDRAFYGCKNLTYVSIPSKAQKIGKEAFSGCALKEVRCYIKDPKPTGLRAFEGCEKATLYVPTGTRKAYHNTVDWWTFRNIIEF